ncbi:type II toxin-antitoxin system Phd/YefM family antitoxin [Sphingomonas hylomeconis]|uniref:Antitoxin n=1 Tax=Sphingomonas hylomeconis TaxID=1395958 RepID=A0ABV7SVG9_9SPHN|nr:type II toxin-antitoxin system Phd/YefM family antitoxin [Sphingomonas hylomeconis]
MTSRAFNQDISQAKRAARLAPVVVTDRGTPTHVLLSIEAYQRLSGARDTIVDLLAARDDDAAPLTIAPADGAWGNPR